MAASAGISPAVSIQERGFDGDPVAGHRAAGILGDPHVILVPNPPEELFDPDREFQALVIPLPLDVQSTIERHDAWCLKAARVDSPSGAPLAALFTLARPSRYAPTLGAFRADKLGGAVEANGGDLWAALESLGIVAPGVREGPGQDVLRGVPDVEKAQRRYGIREHQLRTPGEIGSWLCTVFCVCEPGGG